MKRKLEYRGGRIIDFLADMKSEIHRRYGEVPRDVLLHPEMYYKFIDEMKYLQGRTEMYRKNGDLIALEFMDMEVYESRQADANFGTFFTQPINVPKQFTFVQKKISEPFTEFPMTPEDCIAPKGKKKLMFKKPKRSELC